MKILLGFFIGMTVALLLILSMNRSGPAVSADDSSTSVTAANSATTLPDGTDVTGLMPDVKKVYNNALGEPYRQVESEITDPGIAKFYRAYMDATGLDKVGLEK